MSTRPNVPAGAPAWADLSTSDQPASLAFYTALFGWTAEEPQPELGGYVGFRRDGQRIAGCAPAMAGAPADVWTVHLATDDAEQSTALAAAHGGTVVAPAMAGPDLVIFSIVTDPAGAALGVMQPGTHVGITTIGEPGAPSWFELHTRSYDEALAFYRDVFGWKTEVLADEPRFRYSQAVVDGEPVAGVMDASGLPADAPLGWSTYWMVDDVEATLRDVERLGGRVVRPRDETPYGVLATCTDPTGATFKLQTPPSDRTRS